MIVLGYSFFAPDADAHEAGVMLRDRMLLSLCGLSEPRILRGEMGKPYLADYPEISFSVSHTEHLAVCAVSFPGIADAGEWTMMDDSADAPTVGVDAEVLRPADQAARLSRIAQRFLPASGRQRMEHLADEQISRVFAEEWTRCESYVKMTGRGFENGFSSLCFDGVHSEFLRLNRDGAEYVISITWREEETDLSLLEKLRENGESGRLPFHMPGHKRNAERFSYLQSLGAAEDITEIDGFDNLHGAEGILADAMENAAKLWHSDRSYFLINGSTCGILAGIRAMTKRGDTVIVSRNAHKSVYHAIELCGLRPVFLLPPWDEERGMFLSLPSETVEDALCRWPEASLVILTSPTYEGVLSDIASISRIAHEHGAALLVDEAHGAHLLGDPFPRGAVLSGADIVVQSLHKTLPSFTQTAILHVCGSRVDLARLEHQLAVFETSSPSYLLMASIDGCVRTMSRDCSILRDWGERLAYFDRELGRLHHLQIPYHMSSSEIADGVFACDPSKIFVSTAASDWDGLRLAEFLRSRNIEPEMTARDGVLLMSGAGDTMAHMKELAAAVREADSLCGRGSGQAKKTLMSLGEPGCISPEEALELPWEFVSPAEADQRIAAEYVWAYPPGIPLLVPGQKICADVFSLDTDGPELHSTRGQLPERIAVLR